MSEQRKEEPQVASSPQEDELSMSTGQKILITLCAAGIAIPSVLALKSTIDQDRSLIPDDKPPTQPEGSQKKPHFKDGKYFMWTEDGRPGVIYCREDGDLVREVLDSDLSVDAPGHITTSLPSDQERYANDRQSCESPNPSLEPSDPFERAIP